MIILNALLNYFWLSLDPKESAGWYCDQHVFKIHSEVIESVWDAVIFLNPELKERALDQGMKPTYMKQRHSGGVSGGGVSGGGGSGGERRWHPLSLWNVLRKENAERSLLNAKYIVREHTRRTGTVHSCKKDLDYLLEVIDEVDFPSSKFSDGKLKFGSLSSKTQHFLDFQLKDRKTLLEEASYPELRGCTEPPKCINEVLFPKVKTQDLVTSYRNYYLAKAISPQEGGNGVSGGMRYYYTSPPRWMKPQQERLLLQRKGVRKEVASKEASCGRKVKYVKCIFHPLSQE